MASLVAVETTSRPLDGLIALRTVENLLHGNGPVFNAGEQVEANTSTLWTYVLAVGGLQPRLRLEWVAVVLGLVSAVGGLFFGLDGARRLFRPGGSCRPAGPRQSSRPPATRSSTRRRSRRPGWRWAGRRSTRCSTRVRAPLTFDRFWQNLIHSLGRSRLGSTRGRSSRRTSADPHRISTGTALSLRPRSPGIIGVMTHRHWLEDFETEAGRRRSREDPPWARGARLDPDVARSIQRFQVGEAGDGANLVAKAGDDAVYLAAVKLFVAEEQNHARMLAELLRAAGVPTIASHWSDTAFVRLRRALGLRLEVMVLLIAEVVALRYYRALRDGTADPLVTRVASLILADEERHVPFHCHRLRLGFATLGKPARALVFGAWRLFLLGVTVTVAADHGRALRKLGVGRLVFVAEVVTAFEAALARIRGDEPKPRYLPKRARPRGLF